ncbi:MAG: hypothetical protein VW349_01385 [Gammaproteobacteria bacterium]
MNRLARWQLSLKRKDKGFLFDGDDAVFKALLPQTNTYAEYGVGKSSLWVLANTRASIFAVDTSQYWIDQVRSKAGESAARFDIDWVDLGPIGWAGRPKNYAKRAAFQRYIESPWNRGQKPEVILVDGRFRVACFLYSLASADPGSTILFDDYKDREHYHVVEEFLKPNRFCGRQAVFVAPEALDREALLAEYEKFQYVMD